jgi:hypothetical protein
MPTLAVRPRRFRGALSWLAVGALLALAATPAGAVHVSMSVGHDDIRVDGDDVLIRAEDDREARITPSGDLEVDGREIRLQEVDRRDLMRYNAAVHELEDQAIALGAQGAGLAFHAIGEAIAALASGDGGRAERRIEARAEDIKEDARELCRDMRRLERLQDRLAWRLAAFRPFAVIDLDDDDCRVDD